jgi:uncharacterized membrane protein YwzB
MSTTKAAARRAGILYLLLAITGSFSDVYISGAFIVAGDAAATARNITASELTYRVGILCGVAADIIFIFVALSLYELLKDVDRTQARLMVVLVSVGAALSLANRLNQLAPLVVLSGADFLAAFSQPQLDALALAFLRLRSNGTTVAMVFWALWLFPFGTLVIKSRLFPKVLGVLLIVGGISYLTLSVTSIVVPAYRGVVSQVALPFFAIGELSMIAWLLVARLAGPAGSASSAT